MMRAFDPTPCSILLPRHIYPLTWNLEALMSDTPKNPASISFVTRERCSTADIGGYSWMILPRGDGSVELRPSGEPRLVDVALYELPDVNGGAPTYRASVRAPGIDDLVARQDGFAHAEAALAWACAVDFATRQAGGGAGVRHVQLVIATPSGLMSPQEVR